MDGTRAVAFIEQHGMALHSGKGRIPSMVEAIAGEPIKGTWWSHPRAKLIFNTLSELAESEDLMMFRLVDGKLTWVHRRMWPVLVRAAPQLDPSLLTAIKQVHTESGAHRNEERPYPSWVTPEVQRAAAAVKDEDVDALLALCRPRGRKR